MAKRKRLSPARALEIQAATGPLETKSAFVPDTRAAPPIAQVAGAAASTAALQNLADEVRAAREGGRLVQELALEVIDADYLVRDRIVADEDALNTLMQSLRARGQQTPVEVVALEQGRYGLISGARRLSALRRLHQDEPQGGFGSILALLRRPQNASDAYLAMVEENEIRVGLSYYERARIVARAAEKRVYPTEARALSGLFASASRARRSKIGSFLKIYTALDDRLRFGAAIPERLGLALVRAIERDPGLAHKLRDRLRKAGAQTSAQEIAVLERAVSGKAPKKALTGTLDTHSEPASPTVPGEKVVPGFHMEASPGRLVLSGSRVTAALADDLRLWLRQRR
ncbi:MAG: ParB/RepB/Spo0J family partition protein [Paracoccaceae bacterium]